MAAAAQPEPAFRNARCLIDGCERNAHGGTYRPAYPARGAGDATTLPEVNQFCSGWSVSQVSAPPSHQQSHFLPQPNRALL
jgi:hypothetical protein